MTFFIQHNGMLTYVLWVDWFILTLGHQTSHICCSQPVWLTCHSARLRIVLLLPCFHPDFENIFNQNFFFFFFEILKKKKPQVQILFRSMLPVYSVVMIVLMLCLTRFASVQKTSREPQPQYHLSFYLTVPQTDRQTDGHSPLPHSTQSTQTYSEKTGKAAHDRNARRPYFQVHWLSNVSLQQLNVFGSM